LIEVIPSCQHVQQEKTYGRSWICLKSFLSPESAREKLDALVKDTAAKVSIDKPKAKTKKGPEL